MFRFPFRVVPLSLLALALGGAPAPGAAEPAGEGPDRVEETQRKRKGAGLRLGSWWVRELPPEDASTQVSKSAHLEGFFQKGLDLHLSLESTVGFWRWSRTATRTGTLGETSRETVDTYLVPFLTSLKFNPLTRPEDRLEPFVLGGVGFVLGIEDSQRSGEASLGLVGSPQTVMNAGFGFKAGFGVDWRFGRALSASAGVRYQWIRFSRELQGLRTYRGLGIDTGLTYRFQYD